MSSVTYAVLKIAGEWRLVSQRRPISRVGDFDDTVRAGLRLCEQAMQAGRHAELLVQQPAGELVRAWASPASGQA